MGNAGPTKKNECAHVVLMVHGTWGRGLIPFLKRKNAEWCADASLCQQAIATALGGDVQFRPLTWSGSNGADGRIKAARELAREVERVNEAHPRAKVHVVAHSHAGNIAFYALRLLASNLYPHSIICFSTPFLHIKARMFSNAFVKKRHELSAALSVGLIQSLALFIIKHWHQDWIDKYALFSIDHTFIDMGIVATWFLTFMLLALWVQRRVDRWAARYSAQLELSSSVPVPVFLVRDSADEASITLNAAQFFGEFATRVITFSLRALPDEEEFAQTSRNSRWGLVKGLHRMFASVLVFPLLMAFKPLVALCLLPFGAKFAIAGLRLSVSAESTPPGSWLVHQLPISDDAFDKQTKLRHSTHSDPRALALLSSWLEQTFQSERRRITTASARSDAHSNLDTRITGSNQTPQRASTPSASAE